MAGAGGPLGGRTPARARGGGAGAGTGGAGPGPTPTRPAAGDPDTARVIAFHDDWEADGYREVVTLLSAKAKLRLGRRVERATDLLLLDAGTGVYHVLVEGRGWSHDEWLDWTVTALADQLFGRIVPAGHDQWPSPNDRRSAGS